MGTLANGELKIENGKWKIENGKMKSLMVGCYSVIGVEKQDGKDTQNFETMTVAIWNGFFRSFAA